jgi:hypothetical protein
MAGYTRQSTYTDGDIIQAADSNDEFDQLLAAFNNSTGHAHDGTAAEGPVIGLIGDPGVTTPLNKVVVDDINNQVEFNIDVSGVSTEQFVVKDGVIEPTTDNDIDLGSSGKEFKNLYIDGTANIDSLVADTADINGGTIDSAVIGGTTAAAITGTTITANTSLALASGATVTAILDEDAMTSNSATALATQQSIKAYVDSQVTAQDLDFQADTGGALSIDLDSETMTFTGGTGIDTSGSGNAVTFSIDSTVATLTGTQTLTNKTLTTPIISSISNTGTLTLPTSTDTLVGRATTDTLTNKTLTAPIISTISNTGTLTLPTSTDTLVGRATTDTLTNKTLTSAVLNGTISGTSIKDEDDMVSDSASHLATQQSIKAYVDSQVGANNELSEVLANGNTTGANNIIVTAGQSITVDTISETTAANGVVIDGVTLKDGGATVTADVSFGDNDKAIFGAGSDLQIYHDGAGSVIHDSGTGDLAIRATNLKLQPAAGTEDFLTATTNAEVTLYYNNNPKLATTSTGVDITGVLSSDGLTVDGSDAGTAGIFVESNTAGVGARLDTIDATISNGASLANSLLLDSDNHVIIRIDSNNNGSGDFYITESTSDTARLRIGNNGDVSLFEDTGTTAKFFWDASAERLGIGTDSPSAVLHAINSASSGESIAILEASATKNGYVYINGDDNRRKSLVFQSGGVNKFSMGVGDSDELSADSFFIGSGLHGGSGADLVIDSSGRVKLHEDLVQDEVKATTTATTQVSIDTFPHASYDGAKVVITAATSADTYVTELLIATNGTTAVATEYGQIGTGSALATYDVDISGADVRILATPASSTSTTFRVAMTLT